MIHKQLGLLTILYTHATSTRQIYTNTAVRRQWKINLRTHCNSDAHFVSFLQLPAIAMKSLISIQHRETRAGARRRPRQMQSHFPRFTFVEIDNSHRLTWRIPHHRARIRQKHGRIRFTSLKDTIEDRLMTLSWIRKSRTTIIYTNVYFKKNILELYSLSLSIARWYHKGFESQTLSRHKTARQISNCILNSQKEQ